MLDTALVRQPTPFDRRTQLRPAIIFGWVQQGRKQDWTQLNVPSLLDSIPRRQSSCRCGLSCRQGKPEQAEAPQSTGKWPIPSLGAVPRRLQIRNDTGKRSNGNCKLPPPPVIIAAVERLLSGSAHQQAFQQRQLDRLAEQTGGGLYLSTALQLRQACSIPGPEDYPQPARSECAIVIWKTAQPDLYRCAIRFQRSAARTP
jgi:hypothetical protein